MKRYIGAAVLLAVLAAATVGVAAHWSGPRTVAHVRGVLATSLLPGEEWVVWLERGEGETRLTAAPVTGGEAKTVLSGQLSGLAVSGNSAFVSRTTDTGAELLGVGLPEGETQRLLSLARPADQIVRGAGWLCWRERAAQPLAGVPFVAAAAPLNVVRARRDTGEDVTTLAAVLERGAGAAAALELVGIAEGCAYWLERAEEGVTSSTAVRRMALPDGEIETIAREEGRRTAALGPDAVLWTGPSLEAASAGHLASVKRRPLAGADVEIVGDWLSADAAVMSAGERAYAQEETRVWALSADRRKQRVVWRAPRPIRGAAVAGGKQYLVIGSGGAATISARGLTWWGRVRSLLGL